MKIRYEVKLESESEELYEDSDFEEEFKDTIQSVKNFCAIFGFELFTYEPFWKHIDGNDLTVMGGFTFKFVKILPLSQVTMVSSAVHALSFYVPGKITSETIQVVPK